MKEKLSQTKKYINELADEELFVLAEEDVT